MSLTADVALIILGALFLIGGLAGGLELSAVKIPAMGKMQRAIASGIGGVLILFGIGLAIAGQPVTRSAEGSTQTDSTTQSATGSGAVDGATSSAEERRPAPEPAAHEQEHPTDADTPR